MVGADGSTEPKLVHSADKYDNQVFALLVSDHSWEHDVRPGGFVLNIRNVYKYNKK